MIIREGQPQFRAALLEAYGGRITACDAAPALEAAHVKPYEGVQTNVVTNGSIVSLFSCLSFGVHYRCATNEARLLRR